jgi:hypothetical protein
MTDTNHLEAVLQQLMLERAEIDGLIAALQKRMGKPSADSGSPIPPAKPLLNAGVGMAAASVVYRGAFFSLSVTKAAEKLLRTFGRPLKTPEILSAFQQAEYEMAKGENARSVIYTSLHRSKDFVKVHADTWDLAEKYPEAAAKKAEELATAKTTKTKNKGKRASKTPKAEFKPQAVETKVA